MESTHKAYKPDLEEFISQCEINYWLILRLFPPLDTKHNFLQETNKKAESVGKPYKFRLKSGQCIDFEWVEKAKYTTTILINLNMPRQPKMNLMIRLYHDLELLEVMDKVGPKALKPINKGTELSNKQADEKRQLNRFLGESLKYCLATKRQVSFAG